MKLSEKNKLIIDFMDIIPEYEYLDPLFNITYNYHSDWNTLMKVVEKIESLGFEFFIVENRCRIANNTDKSTETIIDFEITGRKIQATYKAAVEFIKWYNQQN